MQKFVHHEGCGSDLCSEDSPWFLNASGLGVGRGCWSMVASSASSGEAGTHWNFNSEGVLGI